MEFGLTCWIAIEKRLGWIGYERSAGAKLGSSITNQVSSVTKLGGSMSKIQ